jgi:hypothetical protein
MMDRQLSRSMASWEAESGMATRCSGVDCVFLSCFDHNALFLASMLGQGGIRLHRAHTLEMADFLLLATRGTALLWLSAREQESRSSEHSYPGFRLETVK